jgi:hypothetical protein
MIASQKIGKSFMGALNYHVRKLEHPDEKQRAELLDSNFSSMDKMIIKGEVELVRQLRPSLNNYVYHTSLNFHHDDQLDNEMLLEIAHRYLAAMGFTNNQYMIFRHHDAGHGHLHLLVNRITFDGNVVSDSNNYNRSEQVLRTIEREYNLVQVNPSQNSHLRAATKDEIEKVIRTGAASDKMVLQEKMKMILAKSKTLPDFIANCEKSGIRLLFNQQSTGRVSGITYFYGDFKIKGQKLGNQFKWSELVKGINYEQDRNSKEVSEANSRTRATYGDLSKAGEQEATRESTRQGSDGLHRGGTAGPSNDYRQSAAAEKSGSEVNGASAESPATDQDAADLYRGTDDIYHDTAGISIQIADDIDDEAVLGRNRRRKGMARTHTR